MAKMVLLKQAAETTGLSVWELYNGAKSGKYPAMRIGGERGKWVFDLELLEARIQELMLQNVKEETSENVKYGCLRKIQA